MDQSNLTKCFKNEGHNLRVLMPVNQVDNVLPLRRFMLIEVEVDNMGDDLREERCRRYDCRENAANKTIQSAGTGRRTGSLHQRPQEVFTVISSPRYHVDNRVSEPLKVCLRPKFRACR
jgi:hypothetical protein